MSICPTLEQKDPPSIAENVDALQGHPVAVPQSENLMAKIKAAWSIFFPPKPEKVSAKEAGKSRLRMILVADRLEDLDLDFIHGQHMFEISIHSMFCQADTLGH